MDKKRNKNRTIHMRTTELINRKLMAICSVTGKTKTAVLEDLISTEYGRNKKYDAQYYADLEKKL